MQQRAAVFACGAGAHQLRMLAQQPPERGGITRDDGGDGCFERGDKRSRARQRLDMLRELRPTEEAMRPRDDKLRVGQRARRGITA